MKENLFLLGLMGQEKRLLILQPAEQVGPSDISILTSVALSRPLL